MKTRQNSEGFTLIELLIVVAIIAILAAIAVPNFLEAQTRSKVSRAQSDMRTLKMATESYRVDNNRTPPTDLANPAWWGAPSYLLTTPVAYITSKPADPFKDKALWANDPVYKNTSMQPYTYIYNPALTAATPTGTAWSGAPNIIMELRVLPNDQLTATQKAAKCSYYYYSTGPDSLNTSAYNLPMEYDPTNGTTSFGDIYCYGLGNPQDAAKYTF